MDHEDDDLISGLTHGEFTAEEAAKRSGLNRARVTMGTPLIPIYVSLFLCCHELNSLVCPLYQTKVNQSH